MLSPAAATRASRDRMSPRSLRGVTALAAVLAGTCALAPATAAAHRTARLESGVSPTGLLQESPAVAARSHRGCSVDPEATPARVTPGAPLSFIGTLSCPEGVSAAEQTVTLFQKLAHIPGFSAVSSATTGANGAFELSLSGPAVESAFYVRSDGVKSIDVKVELATQISIETPAAGTELPAGHGRTANGPAGAVDFKGTVSPATAGADVSLERLQPNGKVWSLLGHVPVNGEGRFSITHAFFRCGEVTLRFVLHAHGLEHPVSSAPISYKIAPQHPRACHT